MLTLTQPLTQKDAAIAVRIDQTMRAKLPKLPNPLVASWDEGQRLVVSRGEPWIVGPLEIDPYLTKAGGYPFPTAVTEQLQRISLGGARFHRIAIAHEVDPHGPVTALLPKLTRHGLPITPKDTKSFLGKPPAAEKPKDLVATFDKALKKAIGAAKTGATAAGAAAAGIGDALLDPIVFGVVGVHGAPKTGDPAIYYPLAAWIW